MFFPNLLNLFSLSVASLWDVSIEDTNKYSLSYNNSKVLYNSCAEFSLTDYGTRASVCDNKLYNTPNINIPERMLDKNIGNYTQILINYQSLPNISLPNVNCIIQLLDEPKDSIILYLNLSEKINTNWISPMYNSKWDLGFYKTRILRVPYDNDLQSVYLSIDSSGILDKDTSSYVTSFYNNSEKSNQGLVVGFLEHNLWKNGIEYDSQSLSAIAGVNGELITRDNIPHGNVTINQTPKLFIHINKDWRIGMENYAKTSEKILDFVLNKTIRPFNGWNSWSMAVSGEGVPKIDNFKIATDVFNNLSDIHSQIKHYITRDAVYFLNDTETEGWVNYTHEYKNSLTGTYNSPFLLFSTPDKTKYINCNKSPCNSTEPDCFLLEDVILKDKNNNYIEIRDPFSKSHRILDVTHPATRCMLKYSINEIKKNKMDLVKYDFLNLAAYEGERYNMTLAPTGISAYLYAIKLIDEIWNNSVILDFGISLPFPVIKGMNTRRQGCDQMFGGVIYSMNQYAGGWWLKNFYIIDPDLISLQEDYWFNPVLKNITKYLSMDSKGRVAKAIVYGGEFKNGDDLSNVTTKENVEQYFGNTRINQMWYRSMTGNFSSSFRPLSWENENTIIPILPNIYPPSIYTRENGDIVIFNFGLFEKMFFLNLDIFDFSKKSIVCEDILDNSKTIINNNKFSYLVKAKSAAILECREF